VSAAPVSPTLRRWRIVLGAVGIGLLVIGGLTVIAEIPPTRYLGVAAWLGGALIIHDGIGAMAVLGVSVLLRKAGRRVPFAVVLIVQSALAVAAVVTVLVVPAIVKRAVGTANPSILPLDYLQSLLLFHAGLAAVAAMLIVLVFSLRLRRRASAAAEQSD
jgi:hypothetical protein